MSILLKAKQYLIGFCCGVFLAGIIGAVFLAFQQKKSAAIRGLAHQKSERKLKVTLEELGFAFQEIEADSFTMGSPGTEKGRDDDEKQVEVTIKKNYEMAATETTQRQWVLIMGGNPSWFKKSKHCDNHTTLDNVPLCPEHPVEQVSWNQVQTYIERLNALYNTGVDCGMTPKTSKKGCFRLPTEAEWEHAARGGTKTAYSFDNAGDLDNYGWYHGNANQTRQVDKKWENPNRLHDMHGNVWEWVQDYWSRELPGGDDPLQTEVSAFRVIRGGGWGESARNLRSAIRSNFNPDYGYASVGFRLVRTL